MLQKSLTALFALSLAFTACKKKDDAQPETPAIAVADEKGMIEKFSFDGNLKATRRDVSFTGTGTTAPSATATDRQGNANKALLVPDGSTLEINGLPLPAGNASRTVACWVHLNGDVSNIRYFLSYGEANTGKGFGFLYQNTAAETPSSLKGYFWGTDNEAVSRFNGSTSTGICSWIHLTLTYDQSANKAILYVNGKSAQEITPASAVNTTDKSTLRIGYLPTGAEASSTALKKFLLDDLVIYNRALTSTEVSTLASENAPSCF